jgi:hypothetical protein
MKKLLAISFRSSYHTESLAYIPTLKGGKVNSIMIFHHLGR